MDTEKEIKEISKKSIRSKEYYQKNRKRILERSKKYREENRENIRTADKIRYHQNLEKSRKKRRTSYQKHSVETNKKRREKYQNNREEIRKNWKKLYRSFPNIKNSHDKYVAKNREKIKNYQNSYNKKYKQDNAEKIKKLNKDYVSRRLKIDPIFKMVINLRKRIRHALKSQSTKKSLKTLELLGATKEEVWKHLESKFKEGMTRENNTPKGWHIDHIKPISSFDLNDPEQLKECFHYTNLQPLWWWENLSKGDKIIERM